MRSATPLVSVMASAARPGKASHDASSDDENIMQARCGSARQALQGQAQLPGQVQRTARGGHMRLVRRSGYNMGPWTQPDAGGRLQAHSCTSERLCRLFVDS